MTEFEKGMIAGASPLNEKFEQQQEEVAKIASQIEGVWLDRYGNILDSILSDLESEEAHKKYQLNATHSPLELDRAERELLVCILCTIAKCVPATDEKKDAYRQNYLADIKTCLEITSSQSRATIEDLEDPIENIDSKTDERTVLHSVMEYLYLTNGNFEYLNMPLFRYFHAVATGEFLEQTTETIDEEVRAVGVAGLARKYKNQKISSSKEDTIQNQPKPKLYIEIPKINKKVANSMAENKSAKELRTKLNGRLFSTVDLANKGDFSIFYPSSEDAETVRAEFENDPDATPVVQRYGCLIYNRGRNIFLDYSCPSDISDELREEIVETYSKYSSRAKHPDIQKWMEQHQEKAKEDYFSHKANTALGRLADSVDRIADDAQNADDSKKAVAVGKKVGGAVLQGFNFVGKTATKVAVGVGSKIEEAGDKGSVAMSNRHFDKDILPGIQRDMLMFMLIELLENGTIRTDVEA